MSANDFIKTLKSTAQVNGIAEDLLYAQECIKQASGTTSTLLTGLHTQAVNAGDTAAAAFFQAQIDTSNAIAGFGLGIPILTSNPTLVPGTPQTWFLSTPVNLPTLIATGEPSFPCVPGFVSLAPIAPGTTGGISFTVNNPTRSDVIALGMSGSLGNNTSSEVGSGGFTQFPTINASPGVPFSLVYPTPGQPIQAQGKITLLSNPSEGDTITFQAPSGNLSTPLVLTFRNVPTSNFDVPIGSNILSTMANVLGLASNQFNPSDLSIQENSDASALIVIAQSNYSGTAGNLISISTSDGTKIQVTPFLSGGADTSSTTVQQLVDGVNSWATTHLSAGNHTPCTLSAPADGTVALNGSAVTISIFSNGNEATVTLNLFDGTTVVTVASGVGF